MRTTVQNVLVPVLLGIGITASATPALDNHIDSAAPPPPLPCTVQSTNPSNFNGTAINGGSFIWFNANFTASGIPSKGATIFFQNSTIQFTADQTYTVAVPNAQITFSPNVSCASTSFNGNTWMTTVPISGSDEIFLSGVAFPVPASFANANGKVTGPVTWLGTFSSTAAAVSIKWKWGAVRSSLQQQRPRRDAGRNRPERHQLQELCNRWRPRRWRFKLDRFLEWHSKCAVRL